MRLLLTVAGMGIPLVVATARTPRGIRKIAGHENLGRIVCANGALLWDARRDRRIREKYFDPTGLAAAVIRVQEALPDAGIALLSAETMFLDDTYVGLRRKGASGAETFCDLDTVVSTQQI